MSDEIITFTANIRQVALFSITVTSQLVFVGNLAQQVTLEIKM